MSTLYYIRVFTDLAFWRSREKQFVEFYEQIDLKVGDFLIITKSPCMEIYRQIIDTTVTGKPMLCT